MDGLLKEGQFVHEFVNNPEARAEHCQAVETPEKLVLAAGNPAVETHEEVIEAVEDPAIESLEELIEVVENPPATDDLLDIAWEVLELTRRILAPQTDRKFQLLYADVLTTLGHLKVEQGDVVGAYSDYEQALALTTQLSSSPERDSAIVTYFLGLASSGIDGKEERALIHYQKAQSLLLDFIKTNPGGVIVSTIEEMLRNIADKIADIVSAMAQEKEMKAVEPIVNPAEFVKKFTLRANNSDLPEEGQQDVTPSTTLHLVEQEENQSSDLKRKYTETDGGNVVESTDAEEQASGPSKKQRTEY